MAALTRRTTLAGFGSALMAAIAQPGRPLAAAIEEAGLTLADAEPFSFDVLKERARRMANEPWRSPRSPHFALLDQIDYTAFNKIVFRRDHSLWRDDAAAPPIQLFHLGRYCTEPCSVSLVENGEAAEILYRQEYFDMPADHIAHRLPNDIGFAGFRAMAPDQKWDWMSFLGASYFRTPGSGRQYGLSARGLAIDTGLPKPEEFPRFTAFWLERGGAGERFGLRVYALLDGPSVTGAFRFDCLKDGSILMEVENELNFRRPVERLGIAPLTSMFWYSEKDRVRGIDWRPEIHDSDGLALWTGSGERIWRPLNNPPRIMTNSFVDENPRGFGFLQRDRNYRHYQDDAVFYDRRPSLWVEPLGSWGRGAVQLVELPTVDEVHDNMVAYWNPAEPTAPGQSLSFRYRLHWADAEPYPAEAGRVVETFVGIGGNPGQDRPAGWHRLVVNFSGGELSKFKMEDKVGAVATASRGEIGREDAAPDLGDPGRFRAIVDLKAEGSEPVDVRLFLQHQGRALTETWMYQYFPEDPRGSVSVVSNP